MPETASPDDNVSIADPQADKTAIATVDLHADDVGSVLAKPNGNLETFETDVQLNADAPPRTNGHVPSSVNGDAHAVEELHERPAKRRRTRGSSPSLTPSSVPKLKPISPPWKKIEAEGPTTFQENGRRKSGRINTLPLELHPPSTKRMTRQSLGTVRPTAQVQTPFPSTHKTPVGRNGPAKRPATAGRPASRKQPPPPPPPPPPLQTTRTTSRSLRRRTPSPSIQPSKQSTRPRRSTRLSDGGGGQDGVYASHESSNAPHKTPGRSPRFKYRANRSGHIPLVHPDQVCKRSKIGTSFADFWERAGEIAVEEGGLFASEDGPIYTNELALRDARLVTQIEHEIEPGGILSVGRCSQFAPEGEEEPTRQWTRQDHMVKAMANFRKLLLAEQQRHRAAAKKLAEACRDEWLRRQPKSAEQLEAEAREKWIAQYHLVARVVSGTWENVRAQVNRQRLEQWEAEEQKRVKAALNEAVHLSEQKLQARRGGLDSEQPSDDDDEEHDDGSHDLSDDLSAVEESDVEESNATDVGSDDENVDVDSDNMSTSDGNDEELGDGDTRETVDEGLTQEELRAKYANLPNLEPTADRETSGGLVAGDTEMDTTDEDDDTSDESVDMDDDLGSSDAGEDGEKEINGSLSENEAVVDSEDEKDGSLLGLFFGKSELKQIQREATDEADENSHHELEADVEMKDATATPLSDRDNGIGIGSGYNEDDATALAEPNEGGLISASAFESDNNTMTNGYAHIEEASSQVIPSLERDGPLLAGTGNKVIDNAGARKDVEEAQIEMIDHMSSNGPLSMTEPAFAVSSGTHDLEVDGPVGPRKEHAATSCRSNGDQPITSSGTSFSGEGSRTSADVAIARRSESQIVSPASSSDHRTEIPFLLRGTLREYQHDGLDWLAGLYANKTNGILADEMGLGKTIQSIALLAHLACHHQVWGPHLVIVPTSVMLNWEMEFKKWCPGFKILAYYGSQEERKRKRQGWNNDDVWNVCITSYQLVLQDQQAFKRRRWHFMVLDEAHNIKNFKSQRWQTLLGFNTQARLLLTGTPLQNNLTELWSLLFFLMPAENGVGGFADLQEFQDWFHKPESQILESGRDQMDEEAKAIISKLHKVLRPYLLRRLKADVEKQMPAKYEHVEFCRLSKRQRELYDGFLSRTDTKETLSSGNYLSIINCLMQLRKVCNHPDLFIDRPIMTSFRMSRSPASEYQITERRVRSLLADSPISTVNLSFLNLVPSRHEHLSSVNADRIAHLSSHRTLMEMREAQKSRAQNAYTILDPTTVAASISYLESGARWGRFEELQHCVYLNALRRQQRPIYGKNVIELVSLNAYKRPCRPKPKIPSKLISWFEGDLASMRALTPTLDQRAADLKTTITKFCCVTPSVVTRDLGEILLGRKAAQAFTDEDIKLSAPVRWAPFLPKEPPLDPWHEARMRHSIQFPDKRLLQFDCGKLQVLDKLLRQLQSGGHRALIFTQMTKVLDILEQFLNIHGHKYLRLDGATKVEQRQILTDRFNNDSRILCFILSTRSGGLGINLTGADTVIFYDQDWNPAMDKQCQDRCHRIGQTRDVHIYRLVSEHTIEANILRKASQKQMLDDVVIQEGEFTTDYFHRVSVRDVLEEKVDFTSEGVAAADAALDRVLGGPDITRDQRTVGRALEQAEDREDVAAARVAEREILADDADFTEKTSGPASGTSTARQGTPAGKSVLEGVLDVDDMTPVEDGEIELNAWGKRMGNIDQYMLSTMMEELRHTKLDLPRDKKKGKKKGRDTRKR